MAKLATFRPIPMIHGYNLVDNIFLAASFYRKPDYFARLSESWSSELGPMFMFNREEGEVTSEDQKAAEYYLLKHMKGKTPASVEELSTLSRVLTMFYQATGSLGVAQTAKAMAGKADVYAYVYGHRGKVTLTDFIAFNLPQLAYKKMATSFGLRDPYSLSHLGPAHTDEVFLQFKMHLIPWNSRGSEDDAKMGRKMVQMWCEFARTGVPDENWPKVKPENPYFRQPVLLKNGEIEVRVS